MELLCGEKTEFPTSIRTLVVLDARSDMNRTDGFFVLVSCGARRRQETTFRL